MPSVIQNILKLIKLQGVMPEIFGSSMEFQHRSTVGTANSFNSFFSILLISTGQDVSRSFQNVARR